MKIIELFSFVITFRLQIMNETSPEYEDDISDETLERVRHYIQFVLTPIVVFIGIAGNSLTVAVLTRFVDDFICLLPPLPLRKKAPFGTEDTERCLEDDDIIRKFLHRKRMNLLIEICTRCIVSLGRFDANNRWQLLLSFRTQMII